jgi:hypothetical protein
MSVEGVIMRKLLPAVVACIMASLSPCRKALFEKDE